MKAAVVATANARVVKRRPSHPVGGAWRLASLVPVSGPWSASQLLP